MPKKLTRSLRQSPKSSIVGKIQRKTKQNKRSDSEYTLSFWKSTVFCHYCDEGFASSASFLEHIYKSGHSKYLAISFNCGQAKCNMSFDTAYACNKHCATVHTGRKQCGVYQPNAEYPARFTRCCATFKDDRPSSHSRHKRCNHPKSYVPQNKGQRAKKTRELGIIVPQKSKKDGSWLKEPPTPISSPTAYYSDSFPDQGVPYYDHLGPYVSLASSSYTPAQQPDHTPLPTYPSNLDDGHLFAVSGPSWQGSGYNDAYFNAQTIRPPFSPALCSEASASYVPSYPYSPSACSSIADAFPSSPLDVSSYGSSFVGTGYNSTLEAINGFLDQPAVPFHSDPASAYPYAGSYPPVDVSTSDSYPTSFPSQFSSSRNTVYSPSEHSYASFGYPPGF